MSGLGLQIAKLMMRLLNIAEGEMQTMQAAYNVKNIGGRESL
jgi:hypothetical protein